MAGHFKVATCRHILSPRMLYLHFHFHLTPIPTAFHAVMIPQSLEEYFPNGGLDAINIPFTLGMDKMVAEYTHHTASLVGQLTEDYVHVVVVFTDHTDEKTRDLFLGPDETGATVAGVINEVSSFFVAVHCLILYLGF